MYTGLLHTHSLLRYFVLIALLVVIFQAIAGLAGKKPFGKWNDKASLYLLIFTHLQLLAGFVLYFISDKVHFTSETMKTKGLRYWAVEHVVGMLIAVVLITVARITSKKMTLDQDKHKRLLIFNGIALLLIIGTIVHGGMSIFYSSSLN